MRVPSTAPVSALTLFASAVAVAAVACGSPDRSGTPGQAGSGGGGSGTAASGGSSSAGSGGGVAGTGAGASGGVGAAGGQWGSAAGGSGGAGTAGATAGQGGSGATGSAGTGGGQGGSSGRGGSGGGGTTGTGGGAGTTPAVVIPGAGNCMPPAGANPADAMAAYNKWRTDLVTSDGAGGFLRVRRPNSASAEVNSTVSEGIAYGMLLAVYAGDQPTFDKLWQYSQLWLDSNGLMDWYINAAGTQRLGTGAASDADEDMAFALVAANARWGGKGS